MKVLPRCECGCNAVTSGYGMSNFLNAGHAQAHATNLRRSASEGNGEAIAELYRRGWKHTTARKIIPAFGVEAEFFGIYRENAIEMLCDAGIQAMDDGYHHASKPYWRVTDDGSVSHEGNELVSPILRMMKNHHDTTQKAVRVLSQGGGQVDRTCGLHVHHSVRGKVTEDVAQTVAHWALFQNVINEVLPYSRHSAGYAQSMHNHAHWLREIRSYGPRLLDLRDGARNCGRYHSINIGSVAQHGTLEFRQHSGTLNGSKISHWTKFTRAFMDIGQYSKAEDLVASYGSEDAVRGIGLAGLLNLLKLPQETVTFYLERKKLFAERGGDSEDIDSERPDEEQEHSCCDCCRICCECGYEQWEEEEDEY